MRVARTLVPWRQLWISHHLRIVFSAGAVNSACGAGAEPAAVSPELENVLGISGLDAAFRWMFESPKLEKVA